MSGCEKNWERKNKIYKEFVMKYITMQNNLNEKLRTREGGRRRKRRRNAMHRIIYNESSRDIAVSIRSGLSAGRRHGSISGRDKRFLITPKRPDMF